MKTKVLQTMPPETSIRIDIDITIFQHDNIVKFFSRCFISLVKFSYWSSFMSISSLFLGLWQFSFTRNWPEILKWEIPLFEFFPISEDWDELGIPDVAGMSLIKCYWMLQNASVAAFTVWLIKGKPTGGKITPDLD